MIKHCILPRKTPLGNGPGGIFQSQGGGRKQNENFLQILSDIH
jgi:hypothetical protein